MSAARRFAYVAAALVAAAVAIAALAPRLVDLPAVRAELQRQLSGVLHGQVRWEGLDVRLLPWPRGVVQRVELRVPGFVASAEEMEVALRLGPLLRGRVELASLVLQRPKIRVETQRKAGEGPAPGYREAIAHVVAAIRAFAPETVLRVDDASLDLRTTTPPLELRGLSLQLKTGETGADLQATTSSNLWKRLRADGHLDYASLAIKAAVQVDGVDIARVAGMDGVGGHVSVAAKASVETEWRAELEITQSDAWLKVPQLPWPISLQGGKAVVSAHQVTFTQVRGAVGDSPVTNASAQLDLTGAPRLAAAAGDAQLGFAQWLPWLRERFGLDDVADATGGLQLRLARLAGPLQKPAEFDYDLVVVPRQVTVSSRHFPAPVRADGGEVRITRAAIQVAKVAVSTADAKALASATIRDYTGPGWRVEASATDGELGEKAARWAVARVGAPQFEPETPLRFALPRLAWGPQKQLEAEATLQLAGAEVGLAIGWSPAALDVRRLAIKDASSDAVLRARIEDKRVQASFSGALDAGSVSALFRQALPGTGRVSGDLKTVIDRGNPRNTTAQGTLKGANLDLEWLVGGPLRVLRLDASADGLATRFAELAIEWAGQPATLRGEIRRSDAGPTIEARLESTGVTLDALLSSGPAKPAAPGAADPFWSLQARGKIEVDAGFVQVGRFRVAPVQGVLRLDKQRAHVDLKQAKACGISFPLELDATPADFKASVHIAVNKQPLEEALRCLSGESIRISGVADLRADLATQGRASDLLRNLSGKARLDLRDGRMHQFPTLSRVMSIANLSGLAELNKAKEEGMAYRTMVVDGRFENGHFVVNEAALDSSVLRVAASGTVGLATPDTQLTVLVAPFSGLDRMVGAIPILGGVLGGALTTLPVAVSGDIRDPRVVPLGPHAVTDQLLGIFERTLKLPSKLVAPAK